MNIKNIISKSSTISDFDKKLIKEPSIIFGNKQISILENGVITNLIEYATNVRPLTNDGYIVIPAGSVDIIINYGRVSCAIDSNTAVTFQKTLPNRVLFGSAIMIQDTTDVGVLKIHTYTTKNANIRRVGGTSTQIVNWFTVGI